MYRFGLSFSTGVGSVSRMISRASGSPTHTGVVFDFVEPRSVGICNSRFHCFEAHARTNGWHGPFSLRELEVWQNTQLGRKVEIIFLPNYTDFEIEVTYSKAFDKLGLWTYRTIQLPGMFLHYRLKFSFFRSKFSIVCSEGAAVISYPRYNFPKLAGEQKFDYVAPAQIYAACLSLGLLPRSLEDVLNG